MNRMIATASSRTPQYHRGSFCWSGAPCIWPIGLRFFSTDCAPWLVVPILCQKTAVSFITVSRAACCCWFCPGAAWASWSTHTCIRWMVWAKNVPIWCWFGLSCLGWSRSSSVAVCYRSFYAVWHQNPHHKHMPLATVPTDTIHFSLDIQHLGEGSSRRKWTHSRMPSVFWKIQRRWLR